VLGTLGGIGLFVEPIVLSTGKWKRDPVLVDLGRVGMDVAFIAMLFLTALTGIALLLRDTAAMGPLLALHLGVVFTLFISTLRNSSTASTATSHWCFMRESSR
jgi:citrate/tricarballylate utilization protein